MNDSPARVILQHPEGSTVHVWCAKLEHSDEDYQRHYDCLSDNEKLRVRRFHFERHRRHFVFGRGILRTLLASYLGTSPNALHFQYGRYGKPALAGADLRFNLSHSHGLALYAIAQGREVGVDIEHIRPKTEMERIAERFFSAHENAMLRAVAAEHKALAFFQCWTRKEAFIKACGEGLSMPLDRFSVTLAPGEPALLLSCDDGCHDASEWSLQEVSVPAGYVGALVLAGPQCRVQLRHWPESISAG